MLVVTGPIPYHSLYPLLPYVTYRANKLTAEVMISHIIMLAIILYVCIGHLICYGNGYPCVFFSVSIIVKLGPCQVKQSIRVIQAVDTN